MTTEPREQHEPSMEEILSSIRRIIADEEAEEPLPADDDLVRDAQPRLSTEDADALRERGRGRCPGGRAGAHQGGARQRRGGRSEGPKAVPTPLGPSAGPPLSMPQRRRTTSWRAPAPPDGAPEERATVTCRTRAIAGGGHEPPCETKRPHRSRAGLRRRRERRDRRLRQAVRGLAADAAGGVGRRELRAHRRAVRRGHDPAAAQGVARREPAADRRAAGAEGNPEDRAPRRRARRSHSSAPAPRDGRAAGRSRVAGGVPGRARAHTCGAGRARRTPSSVRIVPEGGAGRGGAGGSAASRRRPAAPRPLPGPANSPIARTRRAAALRLCADWIRRCWTRPIDRPRSRPGTTACGRRAAISRRAPTPRAPPYCIVMPPPNVTGSLHMGHALDNTIQDTLIRFWRMRGRAVLWQPGIDHAGIATQMVVERQLAQQGMSRRDLGRAAFVERVWAWKEQSGGVISRQLHRLGASADWSRERFTLDEGLSQAVRKVFVDLYREGLIYKDKRLVNWDCQLQTAVSDLEVEPKEVDGQLWYIRYPIEDEAGRHITVATTRPETMLGDTGGRGPSRGPALPGPDRPARDPAAGRPPPADRRRRLFRSGEGLGRGQDHARPRLQRLRGRPPPRPRHDQHHRHGGPPQRRGAGGLSRPRPLRRARARARRPRGSRA